MRPVTRLAGAPLFFGIASGLIMVTAPQWWLAHGMTSSDLGMLGSAQALGYAGGCLCLGRVLRGFTGKYVALLGIFFSACAAAGMIFAADTRSCFLTMLSYGVASAAFWPFCSAWMLDFQAQDLPKTRILRFYNVAWTSGTTIGLLTAGLLCRHGLLTESFALGVAMSFSAAVLALGVAPVRSKPPAPTVTTGTAGAAAVVPAPAAHKKPRRVGLALLLAATCANLLALATRATLINNYPELNQALGHEADRMGYLLAALLAGMLLGFLFGHLYEPSLGRRSTYFFMALCLVLINLVFAYLAGLAALVPMAFLSGVVAAMAFQGGIVAATEYFNLPRTGTAFHESMVGLGGMGTFLSGMIVEAAKPHVADIPRGALFAALRAPYLALAGVAVLVFVLQYLLVTWRHEHRMLLPPQSCIS